MNEREVWLKELEAAVFARVGLQGVTAVGDTFAGFRLETMPAGSENDRRVEILLQRSGSGLEGQPFSFTLDDSAVIAGNQIADRILGVPADWDDDGPGM